MSSSQAYIKNSKLGQTVGSDLLYGIYDFWRRMFKRSFDITMSLIGLLLLAPVFIYVAALIKRDSPGPVFYWGPRMGKDQKPFKILKFRSMYEDQRSYEGPAITAKGDDRITPLGHWLRDTKINELPQLWNVLVGEMSLVGPRPEDLNIAETWSAEASAEILSVRPGITSPASILYHDEEKLLSNTNLMGDYYKNLLPDKMRLDRLYIRFHSFFSDIDIIFWTLAILVPRIAKTHIPEGNIFAGPFTIFIRQYLSWFTLDLLTALTAVAGTSILWRLSAPLNWEIQNLSVLGLTVALIFSFSNYSLKINKVVWPKAHFEDAFGLVLSCGFVFGNLLLLNFFQARYQWLPFPALPPLMLLTAGLLAAIGFLAVRFRLRLVTAIAKSWLFWRKDDVKVGERMIIVGLGEGTQIASWLINQRIFRTAFSVIGVVDHFDPTNYGLKVDRLWMLGGINDLPTLLKKHDVGAILYTLPSDAPEIEYLLALQKNIPFRIIFLKELMQIVDQQVTKPIGSSDFPIWLEERLAFNALHDNLTELPNWTLFQDRLRHSLALSKRNQAQRGFMFVELEGLHQVKDDIARNALLKEVALRLNRTKREVDSLARFSEHSFALLIENVPERPQIDLVIQRVSDALSQPFEIKGQEIKVKPLIHMGICKGGCEAAQNPTWMNIQQCNRCVHSDPIWSDRKPALQTATIEE